MSNVSSSSPDPSKAKRRNVHDASVSAGELVELLNDEYARRVLARINSTSKSARGLANEVGASRATVYRRLNRLEAAGLVTSSMTFDPDGHHRKEYRATFDEATLSIEDSRGLVAGRVSIGTREDEPIRQ